MPSPSVTLLRTQSDERLVALAAGGHERAFEAIVERYRRTLLRHARRYLPEARAEDALQQAFLAAWTALRRGDDVRELRPWLHRIVHNTALNARRAVGYDYDELRETLEGSGGPAELAERRAVVRGTLAGLAALPDRQRDALLRIAVEGRSQDEVAEELGLTQNAVRQLVHRARTSLRAAATAVVPLPLATWLATAGAGRGDVAARVGELVAGAGGSATLAKAGAVAVIAGGAVAGPAVVHDASTRERSSAPAAASARADADQDAAAQARPVRASAPVAADAAGGGQDGSGHHAAAGPGAQPDGDGARRHRDDGPSGVGDSGRQDQPSSHRRGDEDDQNDEARAEGDDGDHGSSGSHRRGDDSGSSRRSGRSGDDDEHGDDAPPPSGGDDDPPSGGSGGGGNGGEDDDEASHAAPSGGSSSGSGGTSGSDDDEHVPAAAPSATPVASLPAEPGDSSGSGSGEASGD